MAKYVLLVLFITVQSSYAGNEEFSLEESINVRLDFPPSLQTACVSKDGAITFVVAQHFGYQVASIINGRIARHDLHGHFSITGISCDENGRFFILYQGTATSPCTLRRYDTVGSPRFIDQIVEPKLVCYSSGLMMDKDNVYVAGQMYDWLRSWRISTSDDLVFDSKSQKIRNYHRVRMSRPGRLTVDGDLVIFGNQDEKSIDIYRDESLVQKLSLAGVLEKANLRGSIYGPYVTVIKPGQLLFSVVPPWGPPWQQDREGVIVHVKYAQTGFVSAPKIVKQYQDSLTYQMYASHRQLVVYHFDGRHYDLRFYNLNE